MLSDAASAPDNAYVSEPDSGSDAETVVTAVWPSATGILAASPEIVGVSLTGLKLESNITNQLLFNV